MTVDHAKLLDLDHLFRWNTTVPHALDLAFGQMALFGHGVGDLLDSLRDFLTEGAVSFANPVAGAVQDRLEHP